MTGKSDHRKSLEETATALGVSFGAKLGDDKLQARIDAAGSDNAVLRVIGPKAGFRRAGYGFGAEPIEIPVADLSETQITSIEDEPALNAIRVTPAQKEPD